MLGGWSEKKGVGKNICLGLMNKFLTIIAGA